MNILLNTGGKEEVSKMSSDYENVFNEPLNITTTHLQTLFRDIFAGPSQEKAVWTTLYSSLKTKLLQVQLEMVELHTKMSIDYHRITEQLKPMLVLPVLDGDSITKFNFIKQEFNQCYTCDAMMYNLKKNAEDSLLKSMTLVYANALNAIHRDPSESPALEPHPKFEILQNSQMPYFYEDAPTNTSPCIQCGKVSNCILTHSGRECHNLPGHSKCSCVGNNQPLCYQCAFGFYTKQLTNHVIYSDPDSDKQFDCSVSCPACNGEICPYGVKISFGDYFHQAAMLSQPPHHDHAVDSKRMDTNVELIRMQMRVNTLETNLAQLVHSFNLTGGTRVSLTQMKDFSDGPERQYSTSSTVSKMLGVSRQPMKKSKMCKRCGLPGHFQKSRKKCPVAIKEDMEKMNPVKSE